MIFEYALEPAVVASWIEPGGYRFFDGKFGIGTRRIACAVPSKQKWLQQAKQAVEHRLEGREPHVVRNALRDLEILLSAFSTEMSERPVDAGQDWRAAVVAEHARAPFQAILAEAPPAVTKPLVVASTLSERSDTTWNPRQPPVLRQSAELVAALAPLLRFAREVRFVDPYFDADVADFAEPLRALIRAVLAGRRTPSEVTLELHTAVRADDVEQHNRIKGTKLNGESYAREVIAAACRKRLACSLRAGAKLRLFIWSRGGAEPERVHNRYVLTNHGSICLPAGFDQAPSRTHTDDLIVLSREQHAKRWNQYRHGTTAFNRVLGPVEIVAP